MNFFQQKCLVIVRSEFVDRKMGKIFQSKWVISRPLSESYTLAKLLMLHPFSSLSKRSLLDDIPTSHDSHLTGLVAYRFRPLHVTAIRQTNGRKEKQG